MSVESSESGSAKKPRVAIVGGGLAGMAAAAALAAEGCDVDLFEARRGMGGRAASFVESRTGHRVDSCQHLTMGCCTNLADLCGRLGIADRFAHDRRLHFVAPDGRCHELAGSAWLPAPLHLAAGLWRLRYLGPRDRCSIARTIVRLARLRLGADARCATFGPWLRRQGQSETAIQRFWSLWIQSALCETPDAASLEAAKKVFVDGFLSAGGAYVLGVPLEPLVDLLDRRAADALAAMGVRLHRAAPVRRVEGTCDRATSLRLADGRTHPLDYAVVAVHWRRASRLLDTALNEVLPAIGVAERIPPAAITAVHLWYDRPITPLPHAVMVGRVSQWLFQPPYARGEPRDREGPAARESRHYYQVVISASHALEPMSSDALADRVVAELGQTFPEAVGAKLIHRRVVRQPAAVFSMRPEVAGLRPPQATAVANLAIAGDWTDTGWPGTMEGAVRSGYLAAEAILRAAGRGRPVLVPDLARSPLSRWLLG